MNLLPERPLPERPLIALPLERKLPLTVLGVLVLILGLSLAVSYYEVRRAALSAAVDRLSALSHVMASLSEAPIRAKLAAIRRTAADSSIIAAFRSPDRKPTPAALAVLGRLLGPSDSLTPPRLLGPDGTPLAPVHLDTPAGLEHFRTEFPAASAAGDSGRVGRLYHDADHTAYWIAAPVRDSGRLLGYVAQERRFNTNQRASQQFRDLIGSDIEMYFRDSSGGEWYDITGAAQPSPTMSEVAFDSLNVLSFAGKRPVLASTTRIAGSPIAVTVDYPMASLLARPAATIRALAVVALALAFIGAIIAWVISRQLTRPLVELTSAAEAIAEGEYSQRVAARGVDEIARLGTAFNRMAEQVEDSSNESRQAVVRLTQSARTQQFLAEASRVLAASFADESLLAGLGRFCVPAIADFCSIHLVDTDGVIRRVQTAHYEPELEPTVRALVDRYDYRIDGPGVVPDVMRSQQAVRIERLDMARLLAAAPDAQAARLVAAVGPTSMMSVPLVARGRAVGTMSFFMTNSGRAFTEDDVALAMELARRTAVAIDNTILYRNSIALRMEAEAASSAKSDFLAKMSHEIRTPINAMMGYAELLQMEISGPITEAQASHLQRIRSSGDHLTALVSEILDLAKIEAGRMDVEPIAGVASDVLEAALTLSRPQAAAKGVSLVVGGAANDAHEPVEYLGDPQRVQQILINLLSNAVKFTAAGGTVSVRAGTGPREDLGTSERSTLWTYFVVEDTGIGIASADAERIFQPFIQVENGYTRNHGGTGLGLTISRTLARMMGGELTLVSTPGRGTSFTLWLPAAAMVVG